MYADRKGENMKDGFIKVSAGTPDVRVADCEYNAGEIICMVHEMAEKGAMVMVFPELCITGYTLSLIHI